MSEEMANGADSANGKKGVKRSPAFPFIDLETAVQRAEKFYGKNQDHDAAPEIAVTFWDYSQKSSGGRQTIAALKQYGLLDVDKNGRVRLSDRGLDVVMPGSPKRNAAIRAAALSPPEFRELWDAYGEKLPETGQLRYDLVRGEKKFNPNSVDDFISNYRATITYAKLRKSGKVGSEDGAPEDNGDPGNADSASQLAGVGDSIQWESRGVAQFPEPRRVRAVTPDGEWLFVDGSETGLPASECAVIKKAPKEPIMPETPVRTPPKMPLPVEHADTYLLTIPYKGKPLSVRVHMPGETLGSEHFAKVKAHLELLIDDSSGGKN